MKFASKQARNTHKASALKSLSTLALAVMAVFCGAAPASADPILGSDLASFAVLGGTENVTNAGATTLTGYVGVSPGTAITGLETITVNGTNGAVGGNPNVHINDGTAIAAYGQLGTAITNLGSLASLATPLGADLTLAGGGTGILAPGVYTVSGGGTNLSEALTLDGGGNANAAWVFLMESSLITSSGSVVNLINTGSGAGVYWDVASNAELGSGTSFQGNILAYAAIALDDGATIYCGRALSETAVTMIGNTIGGPCAAGLGGSTTPTGSGGLSGGLEVTGTVVTILPFAPIGGGTVPEPGSLALLGLGLAALGFARRRHG